MTCSQSAFSRARQHATPYLVEFDGLEQRAEVAFAESLRAFAVDDLEKNRSDDRSRKNLQQDLVAGRRAVDQDPIPREPRGGFEMPGQPRWQALIIRVRRILERYVLRTQQFDCLAAFVR